MRTSIVLAIAAATAVSANCNPSYNVPSSGECFTACNVKAGSPIVPGWTMDPTSDKFVDSLKLLCTKDGADYSTFMMNSGMCKAGCKNDDPNLYTQEHAGACAWYEEHKNDVCSSESTTTAAGTTDAAATTTSASATATGATTAASSSVPSASSSAPATSGSSSVVPPPNVPTDTAEGSADKLQISSLAMALIAGAGYMAF